MISLCDLFLLCVVFSLFSQRLFPSVELCFEFGFVLCIAGNGRTKRSPDVDGCRRVDLFGFWSAPMPRRACISVAEPLLFGRSDGLLQRGPQKL